MIFNPIWIIRPSIYFTRIRGPVILKLQNHDGGSNKNYIHDNFLTEIIISEYGDKLFYALNKPSYINTSNIKCFAQHLKCTNREDILRELIISMLQTKLILVLDI